MAPVVIDGLSVTERLSTNRRERHDVSVEELHQELEALKHEVRAVYLQSRAYRSAQPRFYDALLLFAKKNMNRRAKLIHAECPFVDAWSD